jgi:holo-[acyl-carrier protein] synthase
MILGLGLDVAELPRIRESLERFGERFATRVLTAEELSELPAKAPVPFLAARFAAKEAAAKALGTGFADGVTMHSIAVRSLPSGAPDLVLSGRALKLAQAMGVVRTHVSLTHGRDVAAAVVILEGSPL